MKRKKRKDYDDEEEDYGRGDRIRVPNNNPPVPKPAMQLVDAFERAYEACNSEHTADDAFTMGRIREYFQAWVIPKMPDPLNAYLEELECRGYRVTSSFDGSPAILVRNRMSYVSGINEEKDDSGMESGEEDKLRTGLASVGDIIRALSPPKQDDIPVYTDDWEDDFSDISLEEEDDNE